MQSTFSLKPATASDTGGQAEILGQTVKSNKEEDSTGVTDTAAAEPAVER